MVDLHTHILHGVDDGARFIEDSLEMIKTASKVGIRDIVLTPHVSIYRPYYCTKDIILKKFKTLKELIEQKNIDVNLYLGAEVDEHDDIIQTIDDGHHLHDSKYVLVDFTMRQKDISEVIYELKHYGYKVIVAHPERIHYLNYEELRLLKAEGAYFQVSSSHLIHKRHKRAHRIANKLLKHNLIDIVSSDAHNIETIKTMKTAFDYVVKKKGLEDANYMFKDFPRSILMKKRSN